MEINIKSKIIKFLLFIPLLLGIVPLSYKLLYKKSDIKRLKAKEFTK